MSTGNGDVLLVGSVPFETVEEVFGTCARKLGAHAFALPDGEIGERSTWVMALGNLTYIKNPDIEAITFVPPEDLKSPPSHDPELMKASRSTFRLKPGVTETTLDLPYASEALKSYEVFSRLRSAGNLPADVRFQVSLPCTHDATSGFFPEAADRTILKSAYERAIGGEIEEILRHIPADDLVIQWDYCTELLAILGARDKLFARVPSGAPASAEERFENFTSKQYLAPMTEAIPDDVIVGYHLCYGTWGGWPMGEVEDIGFCVRLANALVENTPRRVDFLHLPVMEYADDAFFKPLDSLQVGDAKVFLGLELADGVDAMVQRARAARRYLPSFGVSHYCGYGRDDPERVRRLLDDLRQGADVLAN
ncbi:MAG: hypothetical protein F4233_06040 [Rhodospirillaceae bacterium]|nr:hypothetical protein [Rhodospirillaceae bacterium]